MEHWLSRQQTLIGEAGCARLAQSRVAVIGLGGVGGACVEALARCGIGALFLMDGDVFAPSNLNRQLLCTVDAVGQPKAEVAKQRVLSVNPACEVTAVAERYTEETAHLLAAFRPDFVIDAVDQVTAKLQLATYCREAGVANICCLGTGNRMDAAGFTVGDIADTAGCGCPLAKVMRRELKKRGFTEQTVLYSTQLPVETGQRTPASISFVPPVAGYLLAGHAVRTLLQSI